MLYINHITQLASRFYKLAGELKIPINTIVDQVIEFYLSNLLQAEAEVTEQILDNKPEAEFYVKEKMAFINSKLMRLNGDPSNIKPLEGLEEYGEVYAQFPISSLPYSEGDESIKYKKENGRTYNVKYLAMGLAIDWVDDGSNDQATWGLIDPELIFGANGDISLLIGSIILKLRHPDSYQPGEKDNLQKESRFGEDTDNDFLNQLQFLPQIIKHEIRHFVQCALTSFNNYRAGKGFNTGGKMNESISGGAFKSKGDGEKREAEPGSFQEYLLRDPEFYTWLSDETEKFKQTLRHVPLPLRDLYFKVFIEGKSALRETDKDKRNEFFNWIRDLKESPKHQHLFKQVNGALYSHFFITLKRYDMEKWKKAVKEFTKGVESYL